MSPSIQDRIVDHVRLLVARAAPGTRLPTVRRLIAEFGVSQHIVQAAFETLRAEEPGAGLLAVTSPDRLHADWLAKNAPAKYELVMPKSEAA